MPRRAAAHRTSPRPVRTTVVGSAILAALIVLADRCVPDDAGDGSATGTVPESERQGWGPAGKEVTVTEVLDGNTVKVVTGTGTVLTVRALGIDAPTSTECWGPEAAGVTRTLLAGRPVRLMADPTQPTTDEHGHTPAYLLLADGTNYSVAAAEAGAAKSHVEDAPVAEHPAIAAAADRAQSAGRGLWGPPCYSASYLAPAPVPPAAPAPVPAPAAMPAPAPAAAPAPAPARAPAAAPAPARDRHGSGGPVSYRNCAEAEAAGAVPLYPDEPGYAAHLDADNDGEACES
jgi:micrococcal nuclease